MSHVAERSGTCCDQRASPIQGAIPACWRVELCIGKYPVAPETRSCLSHAPAARSYASSPLCKQIRGIGARRHLHGRAARSPCPRRAAPPAAWPPARPGRRRGRVSHGLAQPWPARSTCSSRERRAHDGHGLPDPRLVHAQARRCNPPPPRSDRTCVACGRATSMPKSWRPLSVDPALRAVQVLRAAPLPHRARAEPEHPPAGVREREHDPPPEAVVEVAAVVALRQARRRRAPRSL